MGSLHQDFNYCFLAISNAHHGTRLSGRLERMLIGGRRRGGGGGGGGEGGREGGEGGVGARAHGSAGERAVGDGLVNAPENEA